MANALAISRNAMEIATALMDPMSGGVSQPRNQLNPTVHIGSSDATTANVSTKTRGAMDMLTVTMAQMSGTVQRQAQNHPQLLLLVPVGSSSARVAMGASEITTDAMVSGTVVMGQMR